MCDGWESTPYTLQLFFLLRSFYVLNPARPSSRQYHSTLIFLIPPLCMMNETLLPQAICSYPSFPPPRSCCRPHISSGATAEESSVKPSIYPSVPLLSRPRSRNLSQSPKGSHRTNENPNGHTEIYQRRKKTGPETEPVRQSRSKQPIR